MQNVATGKSELAALPLPFNPDSSAVIDDSSEFRAFLQDASDQAFTQPVEPKLPKTIGDNKLSNAMSTNETAPQQTEKETKGTEESSVVVKQQTDIAQLEVGTFAQISDFTQLAELKADLDIAMPLTDIASKNSFVVVDDMVSGNTDFVAEMDSIVPSVDLLDLLEQSQFTEITILQGQKTTIEDQSKVIPGLVELLKTFSEQNGSSVEASTDTNPNPQSINTLLNNFIAVIEEQNIESESPIKLADILPAIDGDEQDALDIKLLSIVILEDNQTTQTPNIVEGLQVKAQQDIADPNQQITTIGLDAESVDESVAIVAVASEIADFEDPQPINAALIEQPEVKIQLNEVKVPSHSVESKDLKQLLTLPTEKLDKALENLADRLIHLDSTTSNEIENPTKIASTIRQDFVASLKTNIDEIKSQLKQGKQIDSDLKSFVVDSLKQVSQEINHESVSATISRFTQTLELSSALMAHVSTNSAAGLETAVGAGAIERVLTKENQSQSNLLQVKQAKQQVVQFEKAVNIVRSEGQNQLVEKVRWMVNQNNLQADIRLDPPDLGAMKVRVSLSGETASVNIVVQSQQAKDLLDSAAPRLRDLLQEQGIQLGQSSVEQDHRQRDPNGTSVAASNSELASDAEAEVGHQVTEQTILNGQLSGIDYFV